MFKSKRKAEQDPIKEVVQFEDSPKLVFEDSNAQLFIGQWLGVLKNTKIISRGGMKIYSYCSIYEMLERYEITWKELFAISEKMSNLFKQIGFANDDEIVISNGNEEKGSFDICVNGQDEKGKVSISYGDLFEYPPMITIDSPRSTRVFYCSDKDDVRTLDLHSETVKELEATGYKYHHYTYPQMADYAVVEGNGYKLKVDVNYPESTWGYGVEEKEPTSKYFDMKGLAKTLSTVTLPVEAVSFFKTCSGLALVGRYALSGLSIKQCKMVPNAEGEVKEQETDYIELADKRFMLTDGTDSVRLNEDGSWSYNSTEMPYQHSVSQDEDGSFSITSIASQDKLDNMPSQADIYRDACGKVELVKAMRSNIRK